MRVTIKYSYGVYPHEIGYQAVAQQGCQSFRLGYVGSKVEANFMARMFRIALERHDR